MNINKIIKLAQGIIDLASGNINTPNDAYTQVLSQKNFTDYYKMMGPDNFIKLCMCVWFLKQGFSKEMMVDNIDKVFFATVFWTEGDNFHDECEYCNGSGSERCDICDGTGNEECSDCEGDGTIECANCNGTGNVGEDEDEVECHICDGNGTVECESCDGNGEVTCHNCGGEGDSYCDNCNGDGDIETDEWNYYVDFIVCWDPNLYDLMEMNVDEPNPIMSTSNYTGNKRILRLTHEHGHQELESDIDEVYALEVYNELPSIGFHPHRDKSAFTTPPWDLSHLE